MSDVFHNGAKRDLGSTKLIDNCTSVSAPSPVQEISLPSFTLDPKLNSESKLKGSISGREIFIQGEGV